MLTLQLAEIKFFLVFYFNSAKVYLISNNQNVFKHFDFSFSYNNFGISK